ncbi:hypothetical protein C8J57DRAFT_1219572 [Mycena rebaudengoi]|nr:hypothetical protein C8J57DRAFT_1219572 [Mycena rebaudengoi]
MATTLAVPVQAAVLTVAGIPLALVLDACQVIANNPPGFLALYGDQTAIPLPSATPGQFRAWTPPVDLPLNWAREGWHSGSDGSIGKIIQLSSAWSAVSRKVKEEDGRTQLVPKHHPAVFQLKGWVFVDTCGTSSHSADLNKPTFDDGHFVLFSYEGSMITFFLTEGTPDLAFNFHLYAARIPTRILPEFLHARFAWSTFKIAKGSLRVYEKSPAVAKVEVPENLRSEPQPAKTPQEGANTSNEHSDTDGTDITDSGTDAPNEDDSCCGIDPDDYPDH